MALKIHTVSYSFTYGRSHYLNAVALRMVFWWLVLLYKLFLVDLERCYTNKVYHDMMMTIVTHHIQQITVALYFHSPVFQLHFAQVVHFNHLPQITEMQSVRAGKTKQKNVEFNVIKPGEAEGVLMSLLIIWKQRWEQFSAVVSCYCYCC